jgi:hypothetical protein
MILPYISFPYMSEDIPSRGSHSTNQQGEAKDDGTFCCPVAVKGWGELISEIEFQCWKRPNPPMKTLVQAQFDSFGVPKIAGILKSFIRGWDESWHRQCVAWNRPWMERAAEPCWTQWKETRSSRRESEQHVHYVGTWLDHGKLWDIPKLFAVWVPLGALFLFCWSWFGYWQLLMA